eukprot:CAMPEP_0202060610 /NCGR_PEP_ID=MMETSP0963-20130614/38715_1 /ASSEMBLY_ACC=CAM_ASM_000494 /TAXON_ID=4773 /ORGANISM="Schizochytrium aggregatum, Strain ATCC28209" /LENGTH=82 /DNA_ID=CAMNT_0048626745 /DNA_START=32 /DNA_END=277 /DNA_ORIENTATION=+
MAVTSSACLTNSFRTLLLHSIARLALGQREPLASSLFSVVARKQAKQIRDRAHFVATFLWNRQVVSGLADQGTPITPLVAGA